LPNLHIASLELMNIEMEDVSIFLLPCIVFLGALSSFLGDAMDVDLDSFG